MTPRKSNEDRRRAFLRRFALPVDRPVRSDQFWALSRIEANPCPQAPKTLIFERYAIFKRPLGLKGHDMMNRN
jgi:hypothetical protein